MTTRRLFDSEHDEFRRTIRAFFVDEVLPDYPNWAEEGAPPRWFWLRAGELGILGIGVPEEFGGLAGSNFLHSVIVTEEGQRLGLAMGGLRVFTDIAIPYFLNFANPTQKQQWLPKLTRGESVVALAISEPGAGSDMKSMTTRAERDGDDYVINGAKTFISNGGAADLVVLACKTAPAAGRDGVSLIAVETDCAGFTRGRKLDKLGLHAQDLAEISFSDMRVPVANRLGDEGAGFSMLTVNLAQERVSIAINSQGAARAALTATVSALAGSSPGQNVKFELAQCKVDIDAGQALIDQCITELVAGELDGASAAVAKPYASEMYGHVLDRCTRVLGLSGYTEDEMVGRLYLDGRVSRIYGGSSEIMKVIIAREFDFGTVPARSA